MKIGSTQDRMVVRKVDDGAPVMTTPWARSLSAARARRGPCRTLFGRPGTAPSGSLDGLLSDQHFLDFILVEELLELAVRNGLNLDEAQPQELDQHHAEEGRKNVPGRKLVLALLRLLRCAASGVVAFARPSARVLAIPRQFQEAPTRRGFSRIIRRLIEHFGLPFGDTSCIAALPTCRRPQ